MIDCWVLVALCSSALEALVADGVAAPFLPQLRLLSHQELPRALKRLGHALAAALCDK